MVLIPDTLNVEGAPLAGAADNNEAGNGDKNKPGRPPNVDDTQRAFIMTGYAVYRSLRLARSPQDKIADCINQHTVRYIDFFGPEKCFRRGAKVLGEMDEEEEWIDIDGDSLPSVNDAGAVQNPVVRRAGDTDDARHLRQDNLFKAVRKVCF